MSKAYQTIYLVTHGIKQITTLPALLNPMETVTQIGSSSSLAFTAVAAWGRKPSSIKAKKRADELALPLVQIEDGFLRSVGLGSQEDPYSIVFDETGIYYDARSESDIESYIQQPLSPQEITRARNLITLWQDQEVSKYNHLPDYQGDLPSEYVLLVDQTYGDASIAFGLASVESFQQMLDAALANHPQATIVLKVHPDVMAGHKKGNFKIEELKQNPRVLVLGVDAHPVSLIKKAIAVYVVTSQMGFEGLLHGKPVYTFGMPFYAGYGLTHDVLEAPSRRASVSLEQLVFGALVRYMRYINPETNERCEPETLALWLGLQRKTLQKHTGQFYAVNFSRWKKKILRRFFQNSDIRFVKKIDQVPLKANVIVWGMRNINEQQYSTVIRLEDGFLRSVGLGADLIAPVSWVIDTKGIYYNSQTVSVLEDLLQSADISQDLCERANNLRQHIVQHNLTKYNVGLQEWQRPKLDKAIILVPGQVESDASIKYGSPVVRKNMDLLRDVREKNPNAYIVYKPHPDVVAGLRAKGEGEGQASQWCDEVIVDYSMGQLLQQVDEVHVLTSLSGFEALMRGKKVVTYGQPFYAGWGLTLDHYPCIRRSTKRTLNELVAATLIMYPTYVSRVTNRYTSPENALQELLSWKAQGISTMPKWRKAIRPVLGFIAWCRGKR